MKLAEPQVCDIAVAEGLLKNGNGHYRKTFDDLAGLYADTAAFDALLADRRGQVAYEVTSYTPGSKVSDLIMGVTRMEPGRVGDEYFMTRGHIHAKGDRPEIYYGQSGSGLMQLESPEGEVRLVPIGAQTICYVPPFWIHRSINVGTDDLVMMFAYPADSGQDYGIIERSGGMRVRVVDDGAGGWTQIDNPDWRARTEADIAAIHADAGAVA
ncbi:glucose-6-phosphate isomerase [Oceaniglobus indicus]|uniref:glucose-6-phosphate isomerase n=1 Tax=Oceaniglobus indicus TaxID=2047749 RepID=UPI00147605D7|nr:glucose-6-phosphate isomerase [Oceaniglobus indicus]